MTALTRRRTAAAMAALTGLIHLILVPEYLEEKTYIGLLFLGAAVVCGAVAATLWRRDEPLAWGVGALTCAGMFVGFVLSRTVGLPGFHEAEWELSGVITLVADAAFIGLAATGLRGSLPAAAAS
ncbi:hypothetical protein LRS13_09660 [Svornostia abyssi]|uniref:Uncharacterized protein n=1 Tax=Svornostia abyssi TaxID=2898438 RepID=A0ABY5PMC8_9ACTN|nr:hypothetical protein LRS13_09660 [Parviterribacteraceae bacterium J379]